jgi:16S rRNA (adenine1518-N6/adenine1519-N6)-dimethyltransferase
VAIAFQQRRKMLRSALKPLSADVEAWCARAEVDSALRPDQLSVLQYCALARGLGAA